MTHPIVTVLMSVYNGECWLDESIPSVLNQTFRDFEFLIVNDGSTDGSLEIIHRYAANDPRIKVINKQNSDQADSLNQGIRQAKGQWIARIDADDLCEPERLEKQLTLARSDPSLVLIGTGLQEIDEKGQLGKIYRYPMKHNQLLRRLTSVGAFFAHSSAFYRTDVVRSLGGYRPRTGRAEDLDLWLRLSEVGQLASIDLPLVRIRHHEHQISHEQNGRRQKTNSRVAMVSYWLRRSDFEDPVDENNSEESFTLFRNWVIEYLEREQTFEYFLFVQRIKQETNKTKGIFSKLRILLSSFLSHPSFFFRFLQHRIIGEGLTKKLAKAWIRRNPLCAE